jgi:hypothetical protein
MSIDNLPGEQPGPVDDAPKSEAELVADIADLLDDDPETDPAKEEAQATAGKTEDGDEPEIEIEPEDVEDKANADDPDGSQEPEIKGGRFAPDSAKVTLDDGSVITVADLKRNNLFQRDYTKKTTELAAEREQITARKSEVDQQAQSLAQLAERLTVFSQKYLPQPPEPFTGTPDTDPIGYMRYMQQKEVFEQAVAEFNGIDSGKSQLTEAQQRELAEQAHQASSTEVAKLIERDKFFAKPENVKAFFEDAVALGGEAWGLTAEDIGALGSHKGFLVLRDAVRYRKAIAKAAGVKQQVQAKPVVAAGGRRADPKARVTAERNARSERLRTTGSFEAGVAAIEDLIP